MRMFIGSVMVTPTPTALPFMAAITGFVHRWMASVTLPPPSRCVRGVSPEYERPFPPSRSAPAQNILPWPVTTMVFTRGSAESRSNAFTSSWVICSVKALCFPGR